MNLRPINGRILIKLATKERENAHGIIISELNKDKTDQGVIIKIDDTDIFPKSELKVGDRVVFNKYSGYRLKLNDKNLLLIKIDDILGILEN